MSVNNNNSSSSSSSSASVPAQAPPPAPTPSPSYEELRSTLVTLAAAVDAASKNIAGLSHTLNQHLAHVNLVLNPVVVAPGKRDPRRPCTYCNGSHLASNYARDVAVCKRKHDIVDPEDLLSDEDGDLDDDDDDFEAGARSPNPRVMTPESYALQALGIIRDLVPKSVSSFDPTFWDKKAVVSVLTEIIAQRGAKAKAGRGTVHERKNETSLMSDLRNVLALADTKNPLAWIDFDEEVALVRSNAESAGKDAKRQSSIGYLLLHLFNTPAFFSDGLTHLNDGEGDIAIGTKKNKVRALMDLATLVSTVVHVKCPSVFSGTKVASYTGAKVADLARSRLPLLTGVRAPKHYFSGDITHDDLDKSVKNIIDNIIRPKIERYKKMTRDELRSDPDLPDVCNAVIAFFVSTDVVQRPATWQRYTVAQAEKDIEFFEAQRKGVQPPPAPATEPVLMLRFDEHKTAATYGSAAQVVSDHELFLFYYSTLRPALMFVKGLGDDPMKVEHFIFAPEGGVLHQISGILRTTLKQYPDQLVPRVAEELKSNPEAFVITGLRKLRNDTHPELKDRGNREIHSRAQGQSLEVGDGHYRMNSLRAEGQTAAILAHKIITKSGKRVSRGDKGEGDEDFFDDDSNDKDFVPAQSESGGDSAEAKTEAKTEPNDTPQRKKQRRAPRFSHWPAITDKYKEITQKDMVSELELMEAIGNKSVNAVRLEALKDMLAGTNVAVFANKLVKDQLANYIKNHKPKQK